MLPPEAYLSDPEAPCLGTDRISDAELHLQIFRTDA